MKYPEMRRNVRFEGRTLCFEFTVSFMYQGERCEIKSYQGSRPPPESLEEDKVFDAMEAECRKWIDYKEGNYPDHIMEHLRREYGEVH